MIIEVDTRKLPEIIPPSRSMLESLLSAHIDEKRILNERWSCLRDRSLKVEIVFKPYIRPGESGDRSLAYFLRSQRFVNGGLEHLFKICISGRGRPFDEGLRGLEKDINRSFFHELFHASCFSGNPAAAERLWRWIGRSSCSLQRAEDAANEFADELTIRHRYFRLAGGEVFVCPKCGLGSLSAEAASQCQLDDEREENEYKRREQEEERERDRRLAEYMNGKDDGLPF